MELRGETNVGFMHFVTIWKEQGALNSARPVPSHSVPLITKP